MSTTTIEKNALTGLFFPGKTGTELAETIDQFRNRTRGQLKRLNENTKELLATFDAETAVRHAGEVVSGGGIIFDPSLKTTRLKDVPTLDERLIQEFQARLKSDSTPVTVFDVLAEAVQTVIPSPI